MATLQCFLVTWPPLTSHAHLSVPALEKSKKRNAPSKVKGLRGLFSEAPLSSPRYDLDPCYGCHDNLYPLIRAEEIRSHYCDVPGDLLADRPSFCAHLRCSRALLAPPALNRLRPNITFAGNRKLRHWFSTGGFSKEKKKKVKTAPATRLWVADHQLRNAGLDVVVVVSENTKERALLPLRFFKIIPPLLYCIMD